MRLVLEGNSIEDIATQMRDALMALEGNPRPYRPDVTSNEPLPPEPPDLFAEAQRVFAQEAAPQPAGPPLCPDGHGAMVYRPAGTSKRTGKPYDAFYGCSDRDCKKTARAA